MSTSTLYCELNMRFHLMVKAKKVLPPIYRNITIETPYISEQREQIKILLCANLEHLQKLLYLE